MDWDGMAFIVQMWRLQHSPFLKECIHDFIKNLHQIGTSLLSKGDFLDAAHYFAKAIHLFAVLDRDGHLNGLHDRNNRSLNYYLHAEACIRHSADADKHEVQFLDIALQSLQKVSGNRLIDDKKVLRLVANLKKAILEYKDSGGLLRLTGDTIRKYKSELSSCDDDKMKFVMSFFGSGDPREFFRRLWSLLGPADEGASDQEQHRIHGVEMDWIPKEHQQIAQRQHLQKQHHAKKKKSRRDGKNRPFHASVPAPQLPSGEWSKGSRGHPPSSDRSSGGSSTGPSGSRVNDGPPRTGKKPWSGVTNGPAGSTPNLSTKDVGGETDGLRRKIPSQETVSTTSNLTRSQRTRSTGQLAAGPGVLGTYRSPAIAEDWLGDYKFRLACKKCFTKKARKHGYNSYSLNMNPTHFPKCSRDYLLCQLARTPRNGHQVVYGIIRCRPSDAIHSLCDDFQRGDPCKELSCCCCHSREEQDIWQAEKEGRFPRDDVIALLKAQGHHDHGKYNRKSSTPSRSRSESLVSQDNDYLKSWSNTGARPRRGSQVSLDNGYSKSRSNSSSRSRLESQIDQGNGGTKCRSNGVVRSRSGSLQTSNLACSTQHGDVSGSEASKEIYEATPRAVPVQNQFEFLQNEDDNVSQSSGIKTSSHPRNPSSRGVGGSFLMSSGLPFHSSVWESPRSLSSQSNNSQKFQKTLGHSEGRSDKAVLDELKKIGGKFLLVCSECFGGRPVKISSPDPTNPNFCSYKYHSMSRMHNRCLVHCIGHGGFTKIRKRPFRVMYKPQTICWYVDKLYGCERGDSCHFAHSEAEAKLWWLEARFGKERKEILQACIELNDLRAHQLSLAGKLQSNPEALINPHQGPWGIGSSNSSERGNNTLKQPPPTACAVAVESCRSKLPFGHLIKRVCGRCLSMNPHQIQEQNPKRPSYCSGASQHSWGANILYVVHSSKDKQWVRVNHRHPRLWPHSKLRLCRNGKQCKQESAFRTACMHPHTLEELELWEYQKQHNLPKLEEVVHLQQQAQAASTPLPKPEQLAALQHTCSFCKFSCTSQTDFENHLLTTAHKAMIFSDSDHLWKERDPPNLVQDGIYKMCKENATKQCEHSGRSKDENECIYAHSKGELDEWKQRHQHRLMKLRKAREMKLYSWLDNLVDEKTSAEEAEDVITEDIFGIEVECNREVDVIQETAASETESPIQNDVIQWHVVLHCGSEKKLKRVGLLFDEHRSHFHLLEPENEYCPQTCPGGLLRREDSHYSIAVNFRPSRSGLFKQWLVFDFGERPCLALKLSVTIGSKSEVKELEFKDQTVNTADLWTESNSKIIKCAQPDKWTQRLEEQYPTPGSDRGPALSGNVLGLNQDTYKEFMHHMLTDEERACMEMVAKYRTVTEMNVSDQVKLEDSLLVAQDGELFGTIALDKPLHDDSEASRLVQEFVETIFIKFHEQSDVVYEAIKVRSEKGAVVVSLEPACVKERRLKGGKNVSVTFQCCISRQRFLSMHHAVESLSCMDTVLPKGQQPNRFPELADEECLEGLNSRQEQVVRLINSLGTRGGEGTSYSGPTMILGPFGTGKTHTLAKAIQRTLTERKDAKFLICTHSNSAADLYIREYLHEFCEGRPEIWMVRVYATIRKLSAIRETVRKYVLIDDVGPCLPTEEECKEWVSSKGPSIVVVTLSTAVHLTKTATLRGYFSHIVIDEAGQALETEAIIPLVLATDDTGVVLAGDPRQMSPQVHSPRLLEEAKFNMSLLQRLYKYDKQNDCHASVNLIITYRSCQPILDFLKVHYGTSFQSKSTSKEHPNFYPLNFVDVRGEDELVGTSYMNAEEARVIADYVSSLMQNWPEEEWERPKQSEVVVLSPYRVQVGLIRSEMRKRSLHAVTVETVQNVQGKQYRAVLLSTVRTRSSLNKVDITSLPQVGGRCVRNKFWYGFLSDKGLLNTAFTRAQSLITVMGDPVALCSAGECQKTWQRYIKTCEKNHSIHSDQNLTTASIQNEISNAKRLLNPTAKAFVPRASTSTPASREAPHTGIARPAVSRAIEVPSCSANHERINREYPSLTSSRLPASVAAGAGAVSAVDDDDDDEDLLSDGWLQELKIQVDEDMAEEYRRSNPEMLAKDQEEEATSGPESEARNSAPERDQNESEIPILEPEAGVRSETSRRGETAPLQNVANRTHEQVLQNLRMVEREGRYVFLQGGTYDSDDEDDFRMDTSHQPQETKNVQELLRKAVQRPDKYKICIFHQDITGRTYAVPLDRQSGDEITITSMKCRGHALNSDKVLMEVLETEEQQEVEDDDDAGRETKIYGRVVGIIEHNADLRSQKFVCYLDPRSANVMVPIDRSLPKICILGRNKSGTEKNTVIVTLQDVTHRRANSRRAGSFKREVEVKYSERQQKLFIVHYLEWPKKSPYPLGAAVEELEPGNTQQKGLNVLRLVYGIKAECKPAAREQMQREFPEGWCIPDEAVQKREDFRSTRTMKIFTIDPPGSIDLDDAISCVCLPGQRYEVGVHISDVSYFIHQDSTMDKDASKRGTTFYHPFPGDAYHMLPKEMITGVLSLLEGKDRLSVSVIFTLDDYGQIVAEPVFKRSVIQSCQRLTYEEAEKLIIDRDNTPVKYRTVAEPIRCLYELSRHRRMHRLRDGWMVYNADDDNGGALSHPHAHSLVEELMLMTNNAVAELVLARFPDCAPLRRQLAPSQGQVETWNERHGKTARNSMRLPELMNKNKNGATHGDKDGDEGKSQDADRDEKDVLVTAEVFKRMKEFSDSQSTSRSDMESIINVILQDGNHPRHAVALSDCLHIMESAEYVDTTSQSKPEKQAHYSLQMGAYTHFTSPIRRYIDLVVHRMLVASIENSQCPYTAREMADITHHCNNQNAKSKRFDKATKELKLALKLKEAPLLITTFVEQISEKSMKLLLPYRSYIPSRQRDIPFSLLKPSQKPDVRSTNVQVTWKYRMYDNRRKCQADSPAKATCMYPKLYYRLPEDKWQRILQSIKSRNENQDEVCTAIETALDHARCNVNPFSNVHVECRGNVDGRPSQAEMGVTSFRRSYEVGDPCRIQMHSQMVKCMLTPKVQLISMTPHLHICAEHRAQPIECFTQMATSTPGREKNITKYKSKWQQILSMTSCYSAVSADDTVILQNVEMTLEKGEDGITGHFLVDCEFMEKNYLSIFYMTNDGFQRQKYDFLCINFTNLDVDTKLQLKIMEYDEGGHGHHVGPFNADDWKKQSFAVHCRIPKIRPCQRCEKLLSENCEALPVHFVVHQHSLPFPQVIYNSHFYYASTVEFIEIPVPDRRELYAVQAVDKAPVLVRDIVLQRPHDPDTFSDSTLRILRRKAKELIDLRVPHTTLHPLNQSQQAAVKKALHETFSVIQGPPGTGKTVTGAYLAYFFTRLNEQLHKPTDEKRPQVLYCGPSNKSVDVVAGYLKQFKDIFVVRLYSEEMEKKENPIPGVPGLVSKWYIKQASVPEDMADIAHHRLIRLQGKPFAAQINARDKRFHDDPKSTTSRDIREYHSIIEKATAEELQNHHIILCTCNAAGSPRISNSTRIIQVIVDEAGMCSEPETLIPLVAHKPTQVVLVGDHQQLRSIITEPNAKQLGMDISLLEKYKDKAEMLTTQYRMHERICEFPSMTFYENRLETADSVKKRGLDPIRSIWPNNGGTPTVFCHVNGREETISVKSEDANEMSKSNGAEIRHVIRIVREMIRRGALPEKIMVLSQYRLQCAQIEEKLDRNPRLKGVKVSTVVKSQGSEWDYVVISTVRSKPRIEIEEKPSKGWQRKHLGFINDENQMNVALTRAKRGLIIIGNKYLLKCHNKWKKLLRTYESAHCLVDARDFPALCSKN